MTSTFNSDNNVQGDVAAGWESVRTAFEQNLTDGSEIGTGLCVYHRGKCVVDLSGGWKDVEKTKPYTRDTLQLVFSVTKGVTAAAVALCVDRGWLDYEAPVARYWPEFAANGKENITVGQVLSHQAGLPYIDQELTTDDVYNWSRITSLLAAEKPHWVPGSGHGYHAHTLGFLGGELVRRVDPQHRSFGQFIRDELNSGFYVGVPDDNVEARVALLIDKPISADPAASPPMSLSTTKAFTLSGALPLDKPGGGMVFNLPRLHQAEMPGANGITNAHSLASIYALLIGDIDENGTKKKRLVSEQTLSQATTNVTPKGQPDQVLFGLTTIFAKGAFQLYGDFFNLCGEGVFGHKGMGGSCAFAYPSQHLAVAHVCNYLDNSVLAVDPRTIRIIEAIDGVLTRMNAS